MKQLTEKPRYRGICESADNLERIIRLFQFEKENQGYVALGPNDVRTVLDVLLFYEEEHRRLQSGKEAAQ